MSDSDHTQPPPPDAALPGEVEAALARLSQDSARIRRPIDAAVDLATVEAHIAALTAQNAALVAERDALRGVLREVMDWIENWSAEFTDDPEWPATKQKVYARLKAQGEGE